MTAALFVDDRSLRRWVSSAENVTIGRLNTVGTGRAEYGASVQRFWRQYDIVLVANVVAVTPVWYETDECDDWDSVQVARPRFGLVEVAWV